MKKYSEPMFELVAYSYSETLCEESIAGDFDGTIPDDWEMGDE